MTTVESVESEPAIENNGVAENIDELEKLRHAVRFHSGRRLRAEDLLEHLIGGELFTQHLGGAILDRDAVMREALRRAQAWQDAYMKSFTLDLDVKGSNTAATKDGVQLVVKLVAEFTDEMAPALGMLGQLQRVGGTQIRFVPAILQERLPFDPPGGTQPAPQRSEHRAYEYGQAPLEKQDEGGESADTDGDNEPEIRRQRPTVIDGSRWPKRTRGAQPIANEPDMRGE